MKVGVRAFLLILFLAFAPHSAQAQVANFIFTTDPQAIAPGATSDQITVQAQGAGGTSMSIPQTACISLTTTSSQGQFSSSATNWNPVAVLTMSKNTANRSFYYKDPQAGSYTLSAKIALKPESETSSCASWPLEKWNIQWTATQAVTIGVSSGNTGSTQSQTSQSQATPAQASASSQNSQSSSASSFVAPSAQLFADGGADRVVIVGADVEFDGNAYTKQKEPVDNARFLWNFGDGATAEGRAVLHHFDYPGRYAVILDIAEHKTAASDEIIVTAEPASLSFTAIPDGSVSIENRGAHDLDLSHWIVKQGGQQFVLPDHSLVLTHASMHISQKTLGFWSTPATELEYPNGVSAVHVSDSAAETPTPPSPTPQTISAPPTPSSKAEGTHAADVPIDDIVNTRAAASSADPPENVASNGQGGTSSEIAAAASTSKGSAMWWGAAAALALLAAGALVAAKHFSKKEWDIVEEK